MFALVNLDVGGRGVISFAASRERQAELCEREGLFPAPYLARAGWVAAERWDALPGREWQEHLSFAYEVVRGKLPRKMLAQVAAHGCEAVAGKGEGSGRKRLAGKS